MHRKFLMALVTGPIKVTQNLETEDQEIDNNQFKHHFVTVFPNLVCQLQVTD